MENSTNSDMPECATISNQLMHQFAMYCTTSQTLHVGWHFSINMLEEMNNNVMLQITEYENTITGGSTATSPKARATVAPNTHAPVSTLAFSTAFLASSSVQVLQSETTTDIVTSTSSPDQGHSSKDKAPLSPGAISGIAVSSAFIGALLFCGVYFLLRPRLTCMREQSTDSTILGLQKVPPTPPVPEIVATNAYETGLGVTEVDSTPITTQAAWSRRISGSELEATAPYQLPVSITQENQQRTALDAHSDHGQNSSLVEGPSQEQSITRDRESLAVSNYIPYSPPTSVYSQLVSPVGGSARYPTPEAALAGMKLFDEKNKASYSMDERNEQGEDNSQNGSRII